MQLRPYQSICDQNIVDAWRTYRNVLFVMACGGGKTAILANRIQQNPGYSIAIAHRQELVGQMSRTLARYGVKHRIIGPNSVIKNTIQSHLIEFGRDFYDPTARAAVAGVDTLVRRADDLKHWADRVTLWVVDEAHHLAGGNKWCTAVEMFPNAIGLGVTATPLRADGKGLGRHADGLFDTMVLGPQMRELIDAGFLTDYRVFCPPSDLDLSAVPIGADGDYIRGQLALKTRNSTIMGHVVDHYQRLAPGKLGVTFAPDVETATLFSKMFNEAGVRAEVVCAKTPDKTRTEIMKRFSRREILQLVNVDLFGEGFDLPAIEVVTMARATQSYGLFVQQFGRACRLMDGKDRALVIDHVGNVLRHGLPDRPRAWSLDRRDRKSSGPKDPNDIAMKVCGNAVCLAPYEAIWPACPFCGWKPTPAQRSTPEQVDGDLFELDPDTLAAMRGEVARVDQHPDAICRAMQQAGKAYPIAKAIANRHEERQRAQTELRNTMMLYGGWQMAQGRDLRVAQRAFWQQFGVDVMTAQALGRPEAEELTNRIRSVLP